MQRVIVCGQPSQLHLQRLPNFFQWIQIRLQINRPMVSSRPGGMGVNAEPTRGTFSVTSVVSRSKSRMKVFGSSGFFGCYNAGLKLTKPSQATMDGKSIK